MTTTTEPAVETLRQQVSALKLHGLLAHWDELTDDALAWLDQALELFERGQALSRYCAERLDEAELKVQQISNGEIIDLDSMG